MGRFTVQRGGAGEAEDALVEHGRGRDGPERIPTSPEALTPAWVSAALAAPGGPPAVVTVGIEPVGVGVGLLGALYRLDLRWRDPAGAPASVVAKLAARGPMSRAVGVGLGIYRNEVSFYRHLAGATPLAVGCWCAALDDETGDFVLLLDDETGTAALDQIHGCPPDRAAQVVTALADHHAVFWDEAGLEAQEWLRRVDDATFITGLADAFASAWPRVRDRRGDLPSGIRALGDRFPALLPRLAADLARPPVTLSHGDLRLDNMFFPEDGRVTLCDWQFVDRSRGARDLAYFLSQSLSPTDRADHEAALLAEYRGRLAERGVDYPHDEAWRDYRVAALFSFAYPVVAGAGLDLDARSARLADVILDRSVAALVDLDCAALG